MDEKNSNSADFVLVFPRKIQTLDIIATPLRQSQLYYEVYCIALNTIFACVFPLMSLIYLNICTVVALNNMGAEVGSMTNTAQNTRATTEEADGPFYRRFMSRLGVRRDSNPVSLRSAPGPIIGEKDATAVDYTNDGGSEKVSLRQGPEGETSVGKVNHICRNSWHVRIIYLHVSEVSVSCANDDGSA